MMYNRRGSKKGTGPSFCHYCQKQLQLKVGGGYHFTELLTPHDRYPVRVHVTRCAEDALNEGYKKP